MPRKRRSAQRPAAKRRSPALGLALIGGLGLAVRLLYLASIRDAPFVRTLQTNPERYHVWATLILDGAAPPPPFDQAPGYAYLVALLYGLWGRVPAAVMHLQTFVDALSCVLVGAAATRLFGARAGIIAGVLAALCGPLIYFSGEILPATINLFAFTAATTAALYRRWWCSGILLAIGILLRSECLLGLPVLMAAAWLDGSTQPPPAPRRGAARVAQRAAPARAMAVGLPTLLVLSSLAVWSAAATGSWGTPLSGAGLNLWLGNNPHADGVSPFVHGPLMPVAERVRDQAKGEARESDRLFRSRAVDFWRQLPLEAGELTWRKLRWTLTSRELPNTSDIEWQRSHSWLFGLPGLPLPFGAVLVMGLAGLPLLRGRARAMLPLAAGPCVVLVTCLAFFTNARFRLLLLPTLLVLAGAAIDLLVRVLPRWRSHLRQLAVLSGAATAGAWLAFSDPYDVWRYRIPQIDVNTGILERQAGNFDAAIGFLQRGLQATPDDAIAWVHLALALEQDGDAAAAAGAYLDGLSRSNDNQHLPEMTQRFFLRQRLDLRDLETYRNSKSPAVRAAIKQQIVQTLNNRLSIPESEP